jgi:enoyl-CoA hydratase/carnithine racemase
VAEPGARDGGARVRFERQGAVGHVVLEHPPLNLFGAEVLDDLETAVEEAGRAEIRALVVRAEGKVFTGGVDVNMFEGLSPQDALELALRLFRLSHAVEAFRFPPSRASTASASRPASSSRSPAI